MLRRIRKISVVAILLLMSVLRPAIAQSPVAGFEANDTIVCVGNSVFFTDLSVPGGAPVTQWNWSFGDGGVSTTQNPSYAYTTGGNYTVRLIVTDALGNRDTSFATIYVLLAQAVQNVIRICSPQSSVDIIAVDPGISGVSGTWFTSSSAIIQTPGNDTTRVTNLLSGIYIFFWVVSDGLCSDADQVTVIVDQPVSVNAGPDQQICATPGTTNLAGSNPSPGTGIWTTSSSAIIANPSNRNTAVSGLTSAGIYTFIWSVTIGACVTRDTMQIVVRTPVAANAGPDQQVCASSPTTTLAAGSPAPGNGLWSTTGSAVIVSPASANSGVSGLTTAGTYTFIWTITNGGCITRDTMLISVTAPVTANAGPDIQICETQSSVNMAANSPAPGTGVWTRLNGGTIVSATSPSTVITGLAPGAHNFVWTITNGTCVTRDTVRITVNVQIPSNAGLDQTICQGSAATLTGNNPIPANGLWSTSSSATITSPTNSTTNVTGFTSAGVYSFIWIVTNGACIVRDTARVIVDARVTANAGPDQSLCAATASTLVGNSPAPGSGTWTSLGSAAVTTPSSATSGVAGLVVGNNLFVWTITNGSCISRDTVNILVRAAVTANAGPDQSLCITAGSTVLAATAPSVGTGLWTTTGSAAIAAPSSPISAISGLTTAGTYTFIWTVTNGPCVARDTVVISVAAVVASNAGPDQSLCAATASTLAGNSPAPGSGTWTSLGSAAVTTPSSATSGVTGLVVGNNLFVWTITNGSCISRDTVNILVRAAVTANAGPDQSLCITAGSTVLAATTPSVGTGLWTTTGSAAIAAPSSPISAISGLTTAGTYTFIWTVTNGPCVARDTVVISVAAVVTSNAGPDQSLCAATASTLAGNSPAPVSGTWTSLGSAAVTTPSSATSTVTGLVVGNNFFVWTITNGYCVSSDTLNISVSNIPTLADAGSDQSGCADAAFAISGNLPVIGNGTWSAIGSAIIDNPINPLTVVSNLSVGVNTFIWTITNGTCSSSDTTGISVFPLLLADAGSDQNVNSATVVTLGGSPAAGGGSGSYSYLWQPGSGLNDSTSANPQVVVTATSTFVLTVSDSAGCISSDTITIWINNPPDAVDDSLFTDEDTAVPLSLLSNDTDPDNNIDTTSLVILSGPFNGTWISGTGANGTYVPNPDFYGVDSIFYAVCDSGMPVFCDSAWVFITVTPINDAPVVQDDNGVTEEDSCISINIYFNDSDTELMLDWSTLTVISSFSNGSYTLDTLTGLLTYCPDSNFTGSDTLVYALCDSGFPLPALCDTAFVVINVGASNDPPVVLIDTISACAGNLSAAIILANDFDPEGDSLSVTLLTAPVNGTALLGATGDILYTSDPAYSGWDSIYYEACDQSGACSQAWLYIYVHPIPQASSSITSVFCAGDSSGAIDVTMLVAGNYLFSWSHGPVTEDVSGLAVGVYTVQISDSNACVLTITDSVLGPSVPLIVNAIVQPIACFGDSTGAIDLLVSGGTAPYVFIWSNGGTSEDIDSLIPGLYTVMVTDSAGCKATLTDSVSAPLLALSLSLQSQHIVCYGDSTGAFISGASGGTAPYSYLWSNGDTAANPTGMIAGIYALTVTDSLGCSLSLTDSIVHLFPALQVQESVVNPLCINSVYGSIALQVSGGASPYRYDWINGDTTASIDSLTAGLYEIIVTDSAGCLYTSRWTLSDSSKVLISLSGDSVLCEGETVVLTANRLSQAVFTWYWNGSTLPDTTYSITKGDAGVYSVEINTACGLLTSDPITIIVNPLPSVYAGSDISVSCDSAITLYAQGALIYNWSPAALFADPGSASPQLQTNTSTFVSVTGTDANGCSASDSVMINVKCEALVIPDGFSPNADGFNDFFVISNLGRYPDAILRIYNRWGNLVYEKERYDNTWNGISNVEMIRVGEVLPDGTYFYILDPNNGESGFTGFVVLRR